MKAACRLCAVTIAVLGTGQTLGQDYPNRPIKMVVAYSAGGATDVLARVVAQKLSTRVKQPVVVENRPGASGMIGSGYVAKAAPDGYTILTTAADTHSINPHVYAKVPYDATRDFTPVALLGHMPLMLIVNPSVKARSPAEFVKLAREQPGKITFSSWGLGSSSHIGMEIFKVFTKTEMLHVPYPGAAPAITALISGQVDAMMASPTVAEPNRQSGKVRTLGVTTPARFPGAPDVATFSEQRMPLTYAVWMGVFAPANVPASIVNFLNREINAAVDEPEVRATMLKIGLDQRDAMGETGNGTPEDFKRFLDSEYSRWGNAIRQAKVTVE